MSPEKEPPKTSSAEIEQLIAQMRAGELSSESKEKLENILRTFLRLLEMLRWKNQSIRTLKKMLFGPRTEKWSAAREKRKEDPAEDAAVKSAVATPSETVKNEVQEAPISEVKPKRKGHGRRPVAAYSGARTVFCRHEKYQAGEPCDDPLCGGRFYDLNEPVHLLQFTGQPLITATKYERQVLRCAKCQTRQVARLPEGVKDERFDATADATIALMHYGGGLPWYRQSGLQAMCGVPISPSVLWERCEETANAGLGVFRLLLCLGADGELMHTDDTRVRILSCFKEDRGKKKDEKGRATQTSGFVIENARRRIALYFSGRHHAGEKMAQLLELRRAGLEKPRQMSDALAANWEKKELVIVCKCLAHGRRPVYELAEQEPEACSVLLDAISTVYQRERETVGLSPEARLAYHQEHSGPVMEELKAWIEKQFAEKLIEPNSRLGQALRYWLTHWEGLTTWLRVPGCPLDNNAVERALKQFILMRKNSLFFKNEHGAAVGDILSSLIQTCRLNGVNAWDYLVTLIRYKEEARRNPERFLPWNYQDAAVAARAA